MGCPRAASVLAPGLGPLLSPVRLGVFLLAGALCPTLAPAAEPPPPAEAVVVEKGACPFECCRYGTWTAQSTVPLHSQPATGTPIGEVLAGSVVRAITGEVHVVPTPIEVVQPTRLGDHDVVVGTRVHALGYLGEGVFRIRIGDDVVTANADFLVGLLPCQDGCWGRLQAPRVDPTWWVQIDVGNGLVGWTDQSASFKGKDACG